MREKFLAQGKGSLWLDSNFLFHNCCRLYLHVFDIAYIIYQNIAFFLLISYVLWMECSKRFVNGVQQTFCERSAANILWMECSKRFVNRVQQTFCDLSVANVLWMIQECSKLKALLMSKILCLCLLFEKRVLTVEALSHINDSVLDNYSPIHQLYLSVLCFTFMPFWWQSIREILKCVIKFMKIGYRK